MQQILLESTLYSLVLMQFCVHSACRHPTFLIASPVWWDAWWHCLILSVCSSCCHSPWQLIPSKAGCSYLWSTWHAPWSLQPTESTAAVHAGRSKNWDKFIRCWAAFPAPVQTWDQQSCTGCTVIGRGLIPTSDLLSYVSDCGTLVQEQPMRNRSVD